MAGRHHPDRQRGVALVLTLWIVAILGFLVTSFNATVRSSNGVVRSAVTSAKAAALVDAAIELAAYRLLAAGDTRDGLLTGTELTYRLAGARLNVRIGDAAGRIDLNKAELPFINRLFERIAVLPSEARQLQRHIASLRPDAAPTSTPAPAADGARKPSAEIIDIGQFARLSGMTPPTLQALRANATVFNGTKQVNAGTAPRAVLLSVPGMTPPLADILLASRGDDQRLRLALEGLPTEVRAHIKKESGPAYTISISIADLTDAGVVTSHAVIMLSPEGSKPFYVLRREPLPL